MKRRFSLLVLVLCLTISAPVRPVPLGPQDVDTLVRAFMVMVRMWNAMQGTNTWEFGADWSGGGVPYAPYPHTARPGWPGRFAYPPSYPGVGTRYLPPSTPWGGSPAQATGRALNGLWVGNDGTLMLLRDSRFIIQASDQGYQRGTFRVYGNRLTAQSIDPRVTQHYQMERRADMLALKDRYGRIQVFRRVLSGSPW